MNEGAQALQRPSRVLSQGALLFAGFTLSQALSFARNALIAHALSRGDFGIAASITLVLQLIETLSDLGAERIVVQAADGDEPRLVATTHAMLIARGLLTALLLAAAAQPMAVFFGVPEAAWAFQAAALVPLVKGFLHLDVRRAQRRLDNAPQLAVEVLPQALALAATWPVLALIGGYAAVLVLAVLQAAAAVALSHALAERHYALAADGAVARRLLAFGWPILASAIPLVLVYQGDRVVVGRQLGVEALAAYSVAFMVTMVPGLLAAKVGNALMLPLLAACRNEPEAFAARYRLMAQATALAAALYLAAFVVAGEALIRLAFGAQYGGLGAVAGWLALMWSMRMVQAVPGMALMALGETRPLLAAGVIRALALPVALAAAVSGWGLAGIAAAGCAGELASLLYVAWRAGRLRAGACARLLRAAAVIAPAGALALALVPAADYGWPAIAALTAVACLATLAGSLAVVPELRRWLAAQVAALAQRI